MPPIISYSSAFNEYLRNRHEVVELLKSVPPDSEQLRLSKRRELANALYRGSVVLLSSHLERYVESLVVEAIDAINSVKPAVNTVPEALRLIQIKQSLRTAHEAESVEKKTRAIRDLVVQHSWFLDDSKTCDRLSGETLINGFDNPLPKRIRELFRHFNISDAVGFAVKLDTSPDRGIIEIKVKELVEKRNAIAHTGMTADLTRVDIIDYLRCTRKFVRCLDIVVGQEVQKITVTWPWN